MRDPYIRFSAAIPRRIDHGLNGPRGDVIGGLTAAGVALPAAMGFGVVSGLGPLAGLYGAVAAGILAGLIQIVFGLLGLGSYASHVPISFEKQTSRIGNVSPGIPPKTRDS